MQVQKGWQDNKVKAALNRTETVSVSCEWFESWRVWCFLLWTTRRHKKQLVVLFSDTGGFSKCMCTSLKVFILKVTNSEKHTNKNSTVAHCFQKVSVHRWLKVIKHWSHSTLRLKQGKPSRRREEMFDPTTTTVDFWCAAEQKKTAIQLTTTPPHTHPKTFRGMQAEKFERCRPASKSDFVV